VSLLYFETFFLLSRVGAAALFPLVTPGQNALAVPMHCLLEKWVSAGWLILPSVRGGDSEHPANAVSQSVVARSLPHGLHTLALLLPAKAMTASKLPAFHADEMLLFFGNHPLVLLDALLDIWPFHLVGDPFRARGRLFEPSIDSHLLTAWMEAMSRNAPDREKTARAKSSELKVQTRAEHNYQDEK